MNEATKNVVNVTEVLPTIEFTPKDLDGFYIAYSTLFIIIGASSVLVIGCIFSHIFLIYQNRKLNKHIEVENLIKEDMLELRANEREA